MDTLTEMFARGLYGDQSAQEWCQNHFSPLLLVWLNHHPDKASACSAYDEAYFVNTTFHYIWHRSLDRQQIECNTSLAVMQFLRATLHGVILDTMRTIKAASIHTPSADASSPPARENRAESQKLWEAVGALLSNERERRLAYLLFHCRLKPQDIISAFPREFRDVREIARVRITVMQTLSHVSTPVVDPI